MVSAPKSTERPIANCKEWLSQLPGIIVQYWSPACAPTMAAALCGEPIFSIFQPFEKPPIQSIFYTPYAKQLRGHTNTRGACYHILAPHNPFTAWVHFMNRLKIVNRVDISEYRIKTQNLVYSKVFYPEGYYFSSVKELGPIVLWRKKF